MTKIENHDAFVKEREQFRSCFMTVINHELDDFILSYWKLTISSFSREICLYFTISFGYNSLVTRKLKLTWQFSFYFIFKSYA